jgi:hypothetical protein
VRKVLGEQSIFTANGKNKKEKLIRLRQGDDGLLLPLFSTTKGIAKLF